MPIDSLPNNPNIGRLKGHAKELRDRVRSGDVRAVELVREHNPKFPDLAAGTPPATGFRLAEAQLTVARRYGQPSWPTLRRYVQQVNRLSRAPHKNPIGTGTDEFLRLACLNYGADNPGHWQEAADLLVDRPQLATESIFTAAAVGDLVATHAILERDPDAASAEGGPFRWPPLLYVTYSRLNARSLPSGFTSDHVGVARSLLEHGADANAGYLWEGLPSPFTALTGVFGGGEQGAPPHRDELVLARVLLEAGAEANDSQTIYNRGAGDVARDDTAFLELLLDFGLGQGDGGPWRRALGHEHQSPVEIVAEALQHAAEAGLERRTRLLLSRGVDPNRPGTHPLSKGRSPYTTAVLFGNFKIAELLEAAGADTSTVTPIIRFVGACLAGDRPTVERALTADRSLLRLAQNRHRDLVSRATVLGRLEAIPLLVDLGFDVNARRRTTALHEAALRGNRSLAVLLIELGADPAIIDTEHRSTPAGWARHSGHDNVADYLDSLKTN